MSKSCSALTGPDVRSVPVYVYALCEPETGEVRYVGRSSDPENRLGNHQAYGTKAVRSWLRDIGGQRPDLRILRTVEPGDDASAAEVEAIAEHSGPRLLNVMGHRRRAPSLDERWAVNERTLTAESILLPDEWRDELFQHDVVVRLPLASGGLGADDLGCEPRTSDVFAGQGGRSGPQLQGQVTIRQRLTRIGPRRRR